MKKLVSILLLLTILLTTAAAEDIDLSGLSYDKLIALKDRINLAIWNSQEWQEVTVPQGLWEVGKDIPAGKWTIKSLPNESCKIVVGNILDEHGTHIATFRDWVNVLIMTDDDSGANPKEYYIEVENGDYIEVHSWFGAAIFTPYTGKPSFGFK